MRRAVVNGLLRVAGLQEAEDQPTGKAVPAAHAVEDLQLGILTAFVEFAIHPADRAPIVLRCRNDLTERRGRHFEILELTHRLLNHLLEGVRFDLADIVVEPFHFKTERCREIFFIANHHIHVLGNFAVQFAGLGLSANALP